MTMTPRSDSPPTTRSGISIGGSTGRRSAISVGPWRITTGRSRSIRGAPRPTTAGPGSGRPVPTTHSGTERRRTSPRPAHAPFPAGSRRTTSTHWPPPMPSRATSGTPWSGRSRRSPRPTPRRSRPFSPASTSIGRANPTVNRCDRRRGGPDRSPAYPLIGEDRRGESFTEGIRSSHRNRPRGERHLNCL